MSDNDPSIPPLRQLLDPIVSARLAEQDGPADESGGWPEDLWNTMVEAGAPLWSLPIEYGGPGADRASLVAADALIAQGSLTAAFILSQHNAASRRLAASADRPVATYWLDALSTGCAFATVGLSQLTTSRRLGPEALKASRDGRGSWELNGSMPWVTAAERADVFVAGAVDDDGNQLLFALPADRPGVAVRPAYDLAALGSSRTSEVGCRQVELTEADLLAGPLPDVLSGSSPVGTGGLETSALALGQSLAALDVLEALAESEAAISEPAAVLRSEWQVLWDDLIALARGLPTPTTPVALRSGANGIVIRTTQALLTARKGSGFLKSDPAQRWARQALFFLVWSCPKTVAQASIRDLAGLCSLD